MEIKTFVIIFVSIFLAEIGDKTQLATLLFATDKETSKLTVFLASSSALVLASAIGVFAGSILSTIISPRTLALVAGLGFVSIGVLLVWKNLP